MLTALVVTNAAILAIGAAVQFFAHPAGTLFPCRRRHREVPMMSSNRASRYAVAGPVELLELPYKGAAGDGRDPPRKRGGLAAVEAGLTDQQLGQWLQLLDLPHRRDVLVQLPKVQIDSSDHAQRAAEGEGYGASLSIPSEPILAALPKTGVHSQVVHKTFLRSDEKGPRRGRRRPSRSRGELRRATDHSAPTTRS